jgi:carbon monoxide dehydrogenase subunit G
MRTQTSLSRSASALLASLALIASASTLFVRSTLAQAPSVRAQSRGFTADERAALLRGELVRRDLSRREGGRMTYGGASWQRVEAPIETVWARSTEVSVLTRVIPSVDRARVVEERDGQRIVHIHHSYGIGETEYHIRMRLDHAARSLSFELDGSRPHDIVAGRGHMTLTPYRGGTIVEWGMLVDPGSGLVMELFGPMLGEWLLLPPRCLRDELRGSSTC